MVSLKRWKKSILKWNISKLKMIQEKIFFQVLNMNTEFWKIQCYFY